MRRQTMSDDTESHTMLDQGTALSETKPPRTSLSQTLASLFRRSRVQEGPPDPRAYRKATELLNGLPRRRKVRRLLSVFGALMSPIVSFLLWRHIAGPDWWQCLSGIWGIMVAYILLYVKLWEGMYAKYNQAISVVLRASDEQAIGPLIDACCQLPGFIPQFNEIKRTLLDRLERVKSPKEVTLTDTQITILHEIVQGKLLPVSFDAYSRYTILHALVHIGDVRSVACMKELTAEPGKTRIRAEAEQCLVRLEARLTAESQRASLLRAGTQPSQPEATLLRPVTPTVHTTDPAQLLRPQSEA